MPAPLQPIDDPEPHGFPQSVTRFRVTLCFRSGYVGCRFFRIGLGVFDTLIKSRQAEQIAVLCEQMEQADRMVQGMAAENPPSRNFVGFVNRVNARMVKNAVACQPWMNSTKSFQRRFAC